MRKIYLLIIMLAFVSAGIAQLKIVDPANPTVDVNGQTLEVIDLPSAGSLDQSLFIINTGTQSLTMVCTRTEVDGLLGTQNATCWQICPPSVNTGSRPVYTVNLSGTNLTETAAPGDTIKSFEAHYYPQGLDGCSLFKYEWKNETTGTVYGEVYVRFIHQTSGTCTASVNEVAVDFNVYPNPVDNNLNVTLNDAYSSDLNVKIVDMLGKVVSNTKLSAGSVYASISTDGLVEGVYFVNFSTADKVMMTKKIVVRH